MIMKKAADLQVGDMVIVEGRKLRPKIQFPLLRARVIRRTRFEDNTYRFYFYFKALDITVMSHTLDANHEFQISGEENEPIY